jgi:hypothetical protein
VGCSGQLTRTTTILHGLLDILQAQEQVRHRGGDRRAHRGSNPGRGRNKTHDWPQQLDPQLQKPTFFGASFWTVVKKPSRVAGWAFRDPWGKVWLDKKLSKKVVFVFLISRIVWQTCYKEDFKPYIFFILYVLILKWLDLTIKLWFTLLEWIDFNH